jgi:ubiquinone/menaquinone biosynthesis C-methylase UbiE
VNAAESGNTPQLSQWERAYQAFETPEQECRKFISRLRAIGADRWSLDSRVLEVCCGRGSGLRAWQSLGFRRTVGVDLSPALLSTGRDLGAIVLGDARNLPLRSRSIEIAIVQGGLHHLMTSRDVDYAVAEMCRVVIPTGRVVIIEPWLTPFLRLVHAVCRLAPVRRLAPKINALSTMIEEERVTYDQWLNSPAEYLALIRRHVTPHLVKIRWGKLVIVGSPVAR